LLPYRGDYTLACTYVKWYIARMAKTKIVDALKAEKADAELRKEWAWEHAAEAYKERDLLACALARCYPSHRMVHSQKANTANPRQVVCIHTPVGQLNFMLTEEMEQRLADLPFEENHYDGVKRPEKRARMELLGQRQA